MPKILFSSLYLLLVLTSFRTDTNHYYYYDNDLEMDGSNFKSSDKRGIILWGDMQKREHGADNVAFILKMQQKDSLNNDSKKLVDYIKEQKHYQVTSLTDVEKALIRATEQANDSE